MSRDLRRLIDAAAELTPDPSDRAMLDQVDTDLGILARDLDVDLGDPREARAAAFGSFAPTAVCESRGGPQGANLIAQHLLSVRARRSAEVSP